MENNGLIHKIVDKIDKKNVKYILTEKGKSLNKVLYEIAMVTVDSENYSDKLRNELKTSFEENLLWFNWKIKVSVWTLKATFFYKIFPENLLFMINFKA